MQRTSHALVDRRDGVAGRPGRGRRGARPRRWRSASPPACSSCWTATTATARRSPPRFGVPHLRVPDALPGTPFEGDPRGPRPGLEGDRAVVAGARGADRRRGRRLAPSYYTGGAAPWACTRCCGALPPRGLRGYEPEHLLMGHGAGMHGADAASGARARARPRAARPPGRAARSCRSPPAPSRARGRAPALRTLISWRPRSRSRGLVKTFGPTRALDGLDLTVATGRGARVPRPQRRGQVHDDPRPARAAARRRRRGAAARRRPVARRRRAAPPARLRARRRQPVAEPHRRRGHRPARPAARRARPAAPRRAARAVRARPDQEGPRLLQGQPAEGRARRRAGLRRRAADPRRADLGPRPADGGGRSRSASARTRDARAHGAAVQPHPGRGRGAVRPGEHHPRRAAPSRPARSPSCATSPAPSIIAETGRPRRRASARSPGVHDLAVDGTPGALRRRHRRSSTRVLAPARRTSASAASTASRRRWRSCSCATTATSWPRRERRRPVRRERRSPRAGAARATGIVLAGLGAARIGRGSPAGHGRRAPQRLLPDRRRPRPTSRRRSRGNAALRALNGPASALDTSAGWPPGRSAVSRSCSSR